MSDTPPLPPPGTLGREVADAAAELQDDLAAAERLRRGSLSDRTRQVYAERWVTFKVWAEERALQTTPTTPDVLAAFLGGLHRRGRKPATLYVYTAAIRHVHRQEGWPDPTRDDRIKDLLEGARRADARTRKQRRRAPLLACGLSDQDTPGPLQDVIAALPPTVAGWRDRALILVGWSGALRVSELVALDVSDGQLMNGRLILTLRISKTDQGGEGKLVTVAPATNPLVCPVAAWNYWLNVAKISKGPVFRRLRSGRGRAPVKIMETALTPRAVQDILKKRAKAAGLDPERISSHSLRRGFLTTAALKGVDAWAMQRHARHASLRTTEEYVEMGRAVKDGAGEGLL